MNTDFEPDCPWCAHPMASADAAIDAASESFACATCSVVVELAPDPVAGPIAVAA